MAAKWNDAEDAALDYLPWEAQVLYLRGLRRFMDYASGVVGIRRQISRKGLFEVLEVHKRRGSHRVVTPMTKDRLRSLLNILLHAGLIERVVGYEDALVFRLPLADFDGNARDAHFSASMRSAPPQHPERTLKGTPISTPSSTPHEASVDAGCVGFVAPSSTPGSALPEHLGDVVRSAPHPVSGIRSNSAACTYIPRARVDGGYDAFCAALSGLVDPVSGGAVFDVMQVRGSPKARAVIERWVERGVDIAVVVRVAKDKLAAGARIGSVQFLQGPVDDYLREVDRPGVVGRRVDGWRRAAGEVGRQAVVGSEEYARVQRELERRRDEEERKLDEWAREHGEVWDPTGRELRGDWILRVKRLRSMAKRKVDDAGAG